MSAQPDIEKKKVNLSNIGIGAILNLMEVCTLGQPLEVMKTTVASNRQLTMVQALKHVYSRGGFSGFFQGLWPWAIIEASTKGAVLLFSSSEVEYIAQTQFGYSSLSAGVLGGIAGGCAQAYTTLGFCTCMKTVEMTRSKGTPEEMSKSAFTVFKEIYKKEGIVGINRGINAIAMRQMSNWGLRFGFSRYSEDLIRKFKGKGANDSLTAGERMLASSSAALAPTLNQFFEVARIEMQSKKVDPNRPKNMNMFSCMRYIYQTSGIRGLYKGITLRMALSGYQSLFMIGIGGHIKQIWTEKMDAK